MHNGSPQRLSTSVIIPTYNRAQFIREAVDSVLKQTCVPKEIIVIDDGSTDDTPKLLASYGPPVRVVRQENRGRSAARNVGLELATGDAILFLDSDDMLMPQAVERCSTTLAEHPDAGVVYTDYHLVDREGKRFANGTSLPGKRPSGMVLGELGRRCFLTVSSMVRRSALGDIRFDESLTYHEDHDVWRRVAANHAFYFLNEPLMCYRFHDSMTIFKNMMETLAGELVVQQRIMDMPEFARLSRRERAVTYCSRGAKAAMLGQGQVARRMFWRAIQTSPTYIGGYSLGAVSLLGTRALQYAIVKRRKMVGNDLGAQWGEETLQRQQAKRQAEVSKTQLSEKICHG